MALDHQKLDVYRMARLIVRELHELARHSPRRRPDLIDQLNRAAASIVLNIAEGAGEFRPREKARFYRMARRSADEASSVLDLMVDVEILEAGRVIDVQQHIEQTVAMLVRMIQNLDRRTP